jgi:hypothetical protein
MATKEVAEFQCLGNCEYTYVDGNGCYTLTKEMSNDLGAVWGTSKVDITHSFEVEAVINLGDKDEDGADGIAFVIQNIGNEKLGADNTDRPRLDYRNLNHYFAVEVDTKTRDDSKDHPWTYPWTFQGALQS